MVFGFSVTVVSNDSLTTSLYVEISGGDTLEVSEIVSWFATSHSSIIGEGGLS